MGIRVVSVLSCLRCLCRASAAVTQEVLAGEPECPRAVARALRRVTRNRLDWLGAARRMPGFARPTLVCWQIAEEIAGLSDGLQGHSAGALATAHALDRSNEKWRVIPQRKVLDSFEQIASWARSVAGPVGGAAQHAYQYFGGHVPVSVQRFERFSGGRSSTSTSRTRPVPSMRGERCTVPASWVCPAQPQPLKRATSPVWSWLAWAAS